MHLISQEVMEYHAISLCFMMSKHRLWLLMMTMGTPYVCLQPELISNLSQQRSMTLKGVVNCSVLLTRK